MRRRSIVVATLIVIIVASSAVAAYLVLPNAQGCGQAVSSASKYNAEPVRFGPVTEYCLANPSRWANGIMVAKDGTVWFGEQALPGLGHLYANGTVVEYQWPGARSTTISSYQTGIWGVIQWDGKIWGADLDGNRLVGLDPTTGTMTTVNASAVPFPYLPQVAPDGSMWLTSLSTPARLGRMSTNLALTSLRVEGLGKQEPIQMAFVNSTFAYLVALDPLSGNGTGGLYSFDPQASGGNVVASKVGANFALFYPDGVSYSAGAVWVTQHGPSNILRYLPSSGEWTVYPTSTVSYQPSTFTYFAEVAGQKVWFNEHYSNRIGFLDPSGYLTEYSEANPPITNGSQVQNDLTIAAAADGLWFTSTSGNYLGFINGTSAPTFSISATGASNLNFATNSMDLNPGSSGQIQVKVSGSWSIPLKVQVSDSEAPNSVPKLIAMTPSTEMVAAASGPSTQATFTVSVAVQSNVKPGGYTLAVTVTDGLISQTAYVFLQVGQ